MSTRPQLIDLAVILPAYNEAGTICQSIETFAQALPEAHIIVVDNNSSDGTGDLARQSLKQLGIRGEVLVELRPGKASAVRTAFRQIDAHIYLTCDADMTYPAEEAHLLIEPIRQGRADMVVGNRMAASRYETENSRPFHVFGNRLVRHAVNVAFQANLEDIMSGYRAFSAAFVKNFAILADRFELETEVTLHALDRKFRILEVPIKYRDRPEGSSSKLRTFRDGALVLLVIFQLVRYYRPLAFFGLIGLLLASSGLVAAMPVFEDWILHRYIYHVPLAILAAALELAATFSFGIGLILDAVYHFHRIQYEQVLLQKKGPEK